MRLIDRIPSIGSASLPLRFEPITSISFPSKAVGGTKRSPFATTCVSDSQIASEYEDLKRRLAQKYHFDREAYTEAKGPFIARITEVALREL